MASRLLFRTAVTTSSSRLLSTTTTTLASRPHLLFSPTISSTRRSLATATLPPPSKEEVQGAVGRAPQTTDREEHVGGVVGGEGRHFQGRSSFTSSPLSFAASSRGLISFLSSLPDAPKQDVFDLSDPHHGDWTMMHREFLLSTALTFLRADLRSSSLCPPPQISRLLRSE